MSDAHAARERPLLLVHLPSMSPEKLGQHFLTDASWQERIARAVRIDGGVWVEIGAGHGEMTTRLAPRAGKVFAIELDRRLATRLREVTAPYKNVEVVESDVLAVDFADLTKGARFSVYGNLPYYITSPILHRLFEHADRIAAIHAVIQFEVAARIVCATQAPRLWISLRGFAVVQPAGNRIPDPARSLPAPAKSRFRPGKFSHAGRARKISYRGRKRIPRFCEGMFRAEKKNAAQQSSRAGSGRARRRYCDEAGFSPGGRAEELSVAQFAALFRLARKE